MASLLVLKGPNPGTSIALEGDKIVIGRNADCGVVLNLPAVSREHAMLRRIQGKYYIEDLKSRNGTKVNNNEIAARTLLHNNDRIRICDSEFAFVEVQRPPLPESMSKHRPAEPEPEEEESSSTVEATISHSSRQILEAQPAEKLAFLVSVTSDLTQTFHVKELLPKIADSMFNVFKQADRCFIILTDEADEKRLIPEVIRTRHQGDESSARFSRRIVYRCLETGQAFLSEDATADKRIDLSQSIADCRIRSVMCAPLIPRGTGKAFGVLQLDTQARHKKFTPEELKLLVAVAGQAATALENARLHEAMIARASLERDLDLAQRVQASFLPSRPPEVPGYEFFAFYKAAQEVGGDYYDFIPLPNGRQAVMLGDVAGKGVPAALLMAKISSDARFCMLTRPTPADAVGHLNQQMQEAGMLDRFITLMACVLDPAQHQVMFVNAGHLPPLIYRRATGRLEEATARDSTGFPLGVAEGVDYDAVVVPMQPGDVVALFTDGVPDAKNRQGHEFQLEGARAALAMGPFTATGMGESLMNAVKQHSQGAKQADDITIVCLGRTA